MNLSALALLQGIGIAGQASTQYMTSRENDRIASAAANLATRQADQEAARMLASSRRLKGTQRAGYAASGVDVGSGSPLMIALETLSLGAQDATAERQKGAVRRWGYATQADQAEAEGRLALLTGALGLTMLGARKPVKKLPDTTMLPGVLGAGGGE